MRRKAWFELHDQPPFPGFLRDLMTDGLEAMWNSQDIYGPIVPRLQRALAAAGTSRIIDLCSGGGGPWIKLARDLAESGEPTPAVLLTDKYPNQRAFQRIRAATGNAVGFHPDPVDATCIPPELAGFRTMFTTFHHFAPCEARAILKDAFDQGQGIAIFETPKCDARTLLAVFLVPLLTLGLVPRIRPFRWSRIFWNYCLPVIPFTLWFDGVMSCLRSYSQADLQEMIAGFTSENYRWEVGEEQGRLISVTYLVGCSVRQDKLEELELEPVEIQKPA
ncbi:MAG TPA: hypothetical protein VHT28_06575 [Silvibacterium sp.]|nr:hypothetical protein [Silvibacterium sp.]